MALSFPSDGCLVAVRQAVESDFRAIQRIQEKSPEAAQWPLGDYSGTPVLIASVGSEAAGFCAWRQTAADEAELLNLAVDPAYRRLGVASSLLTALSGFVSGTLFLEVAEHNESAISLYLRHGWKQIGLRKAYYDLGKTNAVVMTKTSC